jgi:choline dehydrogenase-like flavoprotein
MRSATDVWPGGLGSSSGELGHNLMDHHFRCGAEGTIEGLDDKYYHGRRPVGFYIPRYRNLFGDKRPYVRGFGYQGSASRAGWSRAVRSSASAARSRMRWRSPATGRSARPRSARCCRTTRTSVTFDPTKKDKWGLPVLAHRLRHRRERGGHAQGHDDDMAELLEQTGVKRVSTYDNVSFPGMGIHEMGTARMGRDPKTSVLNAHNQVWDAPNVFVTDGACMASSNCVNPSLTYMALTARAADFAVNELNRRNL